jgi:hypothetical protein
MNEGGQEEKQIRVLMRETDKILIGDVTMDGCIGRPSKMRQYQE